MNRTRQCLFFLLLLADTLSAESSGALARRLSTRITQLIARSPVIQRGHFGYKVLDLQTGQTLAAHESSHFFSPASNTKLYTTALGLVRLGPNYTFQTELRTDSWISGQTAVGDLFLIGGGDPNLSGRVMPYSVDAPDGEPLTVFREMARVLVQQGIHNINGDVIGVASRYPGDMYPDGWTLDDSLYDYGAPVSSLSLNDSSIAVSVKPSSMGDLAVVELKPSFHHLIVLNQITTDASSVAHIELMRSPGSNELVLKGTIGVRAPDWLEQVATEDPALFAAEGLLHVLRECGITVRGQARADYNVQSRTPATLLTVHSSSSLAQIVQVINKVSQNLHAEMLLREVGQGAQAPGGHKTGLEERRSFLQSIGITEGGTGHSLGDGSGLARQDLTTPDSTVALLRYMWARPERKIWLDSLPIGRIDGSLQHRFKGLQGAERIHAKTGSLAHVSTLSGYIESRKGRWFAFSAMVNGTSGHAAEVHDLLDRFCAVVLAE